MDNLGYTYSGNKLTKVTEPGNISVAGYDNGFLPRRESELPVGDHYLYDAEGNLKQDNHNNISIEYNYLNLPSKVTFGNAADNNYIVYVYDAAGTKLAKEVHKGEAAPVITYYNGSIVFEDDQLMFISNSEGRVVPSLPRSVAHRPFFLSRCFKNFSQGKRSLILTKKKRMRLILIFLRQYVTPG